MARRGRFDAAIKCSLCGKTGVATWEENKPAPDRAWRTERKLAFLTRGFRSGMGGNPTIYCDSCNVAVSD